MTWPRLRDLPLGARAGVTCLLLTVLGGLGASVLHVAAHHQNRDERPGLSLEDLEGAYHGVRTTAPMAAALERGHPEGLAEADRTLLLDWLRGDRLSEDFDSLGLGDRAPAEVLDRACLRCHARDAEEGGGIGRRVPLEYWDDVAATAASREVAPVAAEILIASAHTHALGMGALSLVVVLMALCTRASPRLVGALVLLCGLGLLVDLGAWGLARSSAGFVPVIAAAGALWLGATAALSGVVLLELWWPQQRGARP